LAHRLFGGEGRVGAKEDKYVMDYENVATTVFTPIEYGCVGLSHDEAVTKHGEDSIQTYAKVFKPLEWTLNDERDLPGFIKVVCLKEKASKDVEGDMSKLKVIGLHYMGPNAGEVTQGYALAIKLGFTKQNLDETVGIHPTCAELLHGISQDKVWKTGDTVEDDAGCAT